MRTRVVAALAGLALCVLLSSCTEMAKCRAKEKDDFPVLESLARSVMAEVEYENLSRSSYCATTGKPGASVSVEVYGWDSYEEGIAYLRTWGYTPVENSGMLSADGRYWASVSMASRTTEGPGRPEVRYVLVDFTLN